MDPVTLLLVCGLSQTALGTPCGDRPVQPQAGCLGIAAVAPGLSALQGPKNALNMASVLDPWRGFITEAATRFGIPEDWIRAVMHAESGGRTVLNRLPVRSSAGAMGLMQLMPDTYDAMRLRYGLGADPYEPRDNILAGAAYLREMFDRYGEPLFLAAYNAGSARLDRFLFDDKTLPLETRNYLSTVGAAIDLNNDLAVRAPESDPLRAQFSLEKSPQNSIPGIKLTAKTTAIFVPLFQGTASKNVPTQTALFVPLSRATD